MKQFIFLVFVFVCTFIAKAQQPNSPGLAPLQQIAGQVSSVQVFVSPGFVQNCEEHMKQLRLRP